MIVDRLFFKSFISLCNVSNDSLNKRTLLILTGHYAESCILYKVTWQLSPHVAFSVQSPEREDTLLGQPMYCQINSTIS